MCKRILSWLLLVALCVTSLPSTAFAVDVEDGLKILQGDSIVLCEGGNSSLTAELYNSGSRVDSPIITWDVEDPEILLLTKVQEGATQNINFFALKEGDTTITARSGSHEASVKVHVGPCINLSVDGESILTVQEGVTVTGGEGVVSITPSTSSTEYIIRGITPGRTTLLLRHAENGGTSLIDVYVDCYYVLWNAGDTVLSSTVDKGSIPQYSGGTPTQPADKEFTYRFSGWSPEPSVLENNTVYIAQFDATRIYTIELSPSDIFLSVGGESASRTQKVNIQVVPTPTDYGDSVKWESLDKTIATVDDEGTVTAHAAGTTQITATVGEYFQSITVHVTNEDSFYTITFDVPGIDLQRMVVQAGEMPVPTISTEKPENMAASYKFIGWEPSLRPADGDQVYTAKFETTYKEYEVVFQNWDGAELQKGTYHFADTPKYTGMMPTRLADETNIYTFIGWDKELREVTRPITYTAQYKATPRDEFSYRLQLSEDSRSGYPGETFLLTVETVPAEMPLSSEALWYSDNPNVAKLVGETVGVDSITVELVGTDEHGSNIATITVSDGKQTASCTVIVNSKMYDITWIVDGDSETFQYAEGSIPKYPYENPEKVAGPDEAAHYYYTFEGWSPELKPVTGPATYTAVFTRRVNTSIQLSNTSLLLRPGQTATLEAIVTPEEEGLTVSWASDSTTIATVDEEGNVKGMSAGVTTIRATAGNASATCSVRVEAKQYTISWHVEGQEVYKTKVYEGQMPVYDKGTPAKASDGRFDYTFSGWYPELEVVTDDKSYQAQFSQMEKTFQVSWNYDNGDPILTQHYKYGDTLKRPANPTKAPDAFNTYEFVGWSPSSALQKPVTSNLEFTAKYTATEKKGVFINVPIKTKLLIGEHLQLTAYTKPSGLGYKWSSSKPEVAIINDEGYVTAKGEGTTLIQLQSSPDASYMDTLELTVSAERFTITWSVDGKITQEEYLKGETPNFKGETEKPMDNERRYTFRGWDHPIVPVTGPTTYIAQYDSELRYYTIHWVVDGKESDEKYPYNAMPEYKASTDKEGDGNVTFLFNGWEPALSKVTGDQTYTAKYQEVRRTYSITWIVDGVSTQTMWEWGQTPVYKGTPTKEATPEFTYRFTGWNTPIVPVNGTATYIAQFEKKEREYTINWEVNGKRTTQSYHYNDTPIFKGETSLPETAEFKYTFTGWEPKIAPVTADAVYVAQYSKETKRYTITFRDSNGTILQSSQVEYGKTPSYSGKEPVKAGVTTNGSTTTYKFKGWNPGLKPVAGDQTYTPLFETLNGTSGTTVKALFRNWDKEVLQEVDVKAGSKPEYTGKTPTRPIKDGSRYMFTGWSPELTTITRDTVYTAQFQKQDAKGITLSKEEIAKMAKDKWTILEFPDGDLYITADGMKGLSEFKDQITIRVEQSKDNVVTITFARGTKATTITDSLDGITFLATNLPSGDVISVAKGTSKNYEISRFSVSNRAGSWTRIPGTCKLKMEKATRAYTDVSRSHWYADFVNYMSVRGIMIGTTDTTFGPESKLSRSQALVILNRLADCPSFVGGRAYDDVWPSAWYTTATFWATANKLLPALSETKFGINEAITREDLALLLYNYAAYLGYNVDATTGLGKYLDVGQVTPSKVDAMKWAVATGIIEGYSANSLAPLGATTRAEMAAMMMRFISNVTVPDVET